MVSDYFLTFFFCQHHYKIIVGGPIHGDLHDVEMGSLQASSGFIERVSPSPWPKLLPLRWLVHISLFHRLLIFSAESSWIYFSHSSFQLSIAPSQITPKLSSFKHSFYFTHDLWLRNLGRARLGGSFLILVELVGAAGPGGPISKTPSSLTSPVPLCSLASLSAGISSSRTSPCGLGSSPPDGLKQSHLLISGWLPRGEQWMLPGHLRATHGTHMASFLPSCNGQSSHRPV